MITMSSIPKKVIRLDPSVHLFRKQLTDDCVVLEDLVEIRPTTTIKKGQPITFDLVASSDLFLDPSIICKVWFKVTNPDGSTIGNDAPVAPINNLLHSMWNKVEVVLSGKEISPSNGSYMYSAYLSNQFLKSSIVKQDQLQTAFFYEDEPDHFDEVDPSENSGFKQRALLISASKVVCVSGRLMGGIFDQEKLIPPQFNVALRFFPNRDSFLLMSGTATTNEIVTITDMVLQYKKIRLAPSLSIAIAKGLSVQPAVYPINNVQVVVFEEPTNTTLINRILTRYSQVPERILVGIVSTAAYNGAYSDNPFNFERKNCSFAEITVDAQRYPYNGYQPLYDPVDFLHMYQEFCEGCRLESNGVLANNSNGIGYGNYCKTGNGLFVFNITPNKSGVPTGRRDASISLKMKFPATDVDEAIVVVVFLSYNNIYLGHDTSVITDWI